MTELYPSNVGLNAVRFPITYNPPSEIEVKVFTAFGKARYALGIPIEQMVEGYDYHKKIIPYNPNREDPVNIPYGQTRYRKKGRFEKRK